MSNDKRQKLIEYLREQLGLVDQSASTYKGEWDEEERQLGGFIEYLDENSAVVVMAKNGNETEDVWMHEFQRIAGPDATLSTGAQVLLHTLRMERYSISSDKTSKWRCAYMQ